MSPVSQVPSIAVAVCAADALLIHVIVVPTGTYTSCGMKRSPRRTERRRRICRQNTVGGGAMMA
jgi:hypothetical protein